MTQGGIYCMIQHSKRTRKQTGSYSLDQGDHWASIQSGYGKEAKKKKDQRPHRRDSRYDEARKGNDQRPHSRDNRYDEIALTTVSAGQTDKRQEEVDDGGNRRAQNKEIIEYIGLAADESVAEWPNRWEGGQDAVRSQRRNQSTMRPGYTAAVREKTIARNDDAPSRFKPRRILKPRRATLNNATFRVLTNFVGCGCSPDGVQIRGLVKQVRRLLNWVPLKSNLVGCSGKTGPTVLRNVAHYAAVFNGETTCDIMSMRSKNFQSHGQREFSRIARILKGMAEVVLEDAGDGRLVNWE
ncbi:hypothetical protein B0H19DRAFT_1077745 [Mycena capillaripes]|nr:hypothetical protein B0H19DRAFT_1077745 [Mycena capillaripes]